MNNNPKAFDKSINLLELQPGAKIKTSDGGLFEVVDNPGDGMWIICKPVGGEDEEHPIFAGNVAEIV